MLKFVDILPTYQTFPFIHANQHYLLVCCWNICIVSPQAYVELNEFRDNNWLETARWLGYEENLNPASGKWGPSHVSFLTFKSLIQLRRTMSTGDFGPSCEAEIIVPLLITAHWTQLNCTQAPSSSTWTPAACLLWLRGWLMSCCLRKRSVQAIGTACWELSSWDAGNTQGSWWLCHKMCFICTSAHSPCPSSQSDEPQVTPSGDIQMQTFSITKKVHFNICFHFCSLFIFFSYMTISKLTFTALLLFV